MTQPNIAPSDNDGTLTVSVDATGRDFYDFGNRAIVVRQKKEELGRDDLNPLPSPHTVEFEPTLLCNALCHFCSYERDIEKFKKDQRALPISSPLKKSLGLPGDVVMGVLEALETAGTTAGTFWSGGGDPLVWPSINEAIVRASKFSDVSIQTNGIRLDKFLKTPEDLARIRLATISVYAATSALHHEIAGVPTFDRVNKNIRSAVKLRDSNELQTSIGVKILVDANNYRELPAIVKYYAEIGVDSVGLREVQDYNYGGDGQRAVSVELKSDQKKEMCDIIAASQFSHHSLRNFARVAMRTLQKPVITTHCFNAIDGHFACIDARGEVYTGNPEIGNPDFSIGNILQSPWNEVWGSERHHEVIRTMDQMQQAGTCASALCRHVRANVGVESYTKGDRKAPDRVATMKNLGAFL